MSKSVLENHSDAHETLEIGWSLVYLDYSTDMYLGDKWPVRMDTINIGRWPNREGVLQKCTAKGVKVGVAQVFLFPRMADELQWACGVMSLFGTPHL